MQIKGKNGGKPKSLGSLRGRRTWRSERSEAGDKQEMSMKPARCRPAFLLNTDQRGQALRQKSQKNSLSICMLYTPTNIQTKPSVSRGREEFQILDAPTEVGLLVVRTPGISNLFSFFPHPPFSPQTTMNSTKGCKCRPEASRDM